MGVPPSVHRKNLACPRELKGRHLVAARCRPGNSHRIRSAATRQRRVHVKPSPGDTARLRRRPAIVYYDRNDIEVTSNHVAIGADFYPLRAIGDARVVHRSIPRGVLVVATLAPSEIVIVALTVHGASSALTGIALAVTLGLTATGPSRGQSDQRPVTTRPAPRTAGLRRPVAAPVPTRRRRGAPSPPRAASPSPDPGSPGR